MLKRGFLVNDDVQAGVRDALVAALARVPIIEVGPIEFFDEPPSTGGSLYRPDMVAHLTVDGEPLRLICEVKTPGHPRQVRDAIAHLRSYMSFHPDTQLGIVAAPYLSPQSQAICLENGVGFLDLSGNCHLAGDRFFLERIDAEPPKTAKRSFHALFSPKSAQVLRVLLRTPRGSWRVAELANKSGVSLGHVSNVRSALLDREWAKVDDDGLRLTNIDALLDAWRDIYKPLRGQREGFYTTLHGRQLEERLRNLLGDQHEPKVVLASFSAAQWMAAYGRTGTTYLYADKRGVNALVHELKLSPASSGANVEILVPDNPDIFLDRFAPSAGVTTTSPIQTYLDLSVAGERGQEAAEHLREEMLAWR